MMKERPILFSARLVRAILDGTKTQTRRVIKPEWSRCLDLEDPEDVVKALARCPYGVAGDELWVRETWAQGNLLSDGAPSCRIAYRATMTCGGWGKWRPSIFMPRWASRIQLSVTDHRIERLQDISDLDVKAEGVDCAGKSIDRTNLTRARGYDDFRPLWDSINAKRGFGWADNPWVWVVEFTHLTKDTTR